VHGLIGTDRLVLANVATDINTAINMHWCRLCIPLTGLHSDLKVIRSTAELALLGDWLITL